MKYGFVQVGSQEWTTWLHHAVRKAAEHRLMVDIHDEYRPTGYSRTYPNLMTQEGIAGDETSPTNEQTLTILFTRMLSRSGRQYDLLLQHSRGEERESRLSDGQVSMSLQPVAVPLLVRSPDELAGCEGRGGRRSGSDWQRA